ncbi:MAG: carbohydrate ABC transporter permease [Chloroflexi bacterium]|nr:carbohydrate ABC transporter permease [Chloroflexota bacterium]MBU1747984.1 carbohydrate ABC transporter permease [Chloroflexota bacterium]
MIGRTERSIWQISFTYLVLIVFGVIMIYPFFFMVTSSLKDSPEVYADILSPLGEQLRFDNYWVILGFADAQYNNILEILGGANLVRQVINTAFVTLCVTVGQIVTSVLGGYAFARLRFPGRDWLFRIYLGTLMIPFVVLMVPIYKEMLLFGWVDKMESLIIPWLFTASGTFLMRQFFMGLPRELEEAAIIDGANRLTILWRVFVPLIGPAIATQFTISFLYAWNSFIWPLVIIHNKVNYVVTLGLADIQGGYHAQPPLVLAGATLAIVPTVLVFIFAQRWFVEGVATSGLKG